MRKCPIVVLHLLNTLGYGVVVGIPMNVYREAVIGEGRKSRSERRLGGVKCPKHLLLRDVVLLLLRELRALLRARAGIQRAVSRL